jgi:hypothetical protein
MTRTGDEAVQYALSRVGTTMPDSGLCLQFTRENFAIPALYGSAVDAWYGADYRQVGDRNPPEAVPVWFKSSSPYRHVAFHCYDGVIVTTFNADIRRFDSIAAMESSFGPYAGWGPGLNEVQVWWPPTTPPDGEDDDMASLTLIYTTGSDTWWTFDGIHKRQLAPNGAQQLVDVGLLSPETLAAGPKWLPPGDLEAIPDA